MADRLREERTLGEEEIRRPVPDDLWRKPGSRVRMELHNETKRLAPDQS